jgi:hypothetical protein
MLNPKHLLADARILAAHASGQGLTIDPAKRAALLLADEKIRNGQFSVDDEQNLNALISELARLAKPASLEDLRAAADKKRGVRNIVRLSTVLPFVTIVLVFLVIGLTTNFTAITGGIAELKSLEQEHYWDKLEHAQRIYAGFPGNDRNVQEKAYSDLANEISKLRDVAGGLVLAEAEIIPIIDQTSGGPRWCYLTFHFYGLDGWCSGSVPVVAASSAATSNPNTPETAARSPGASSSVTPTASPTATAPASPESITPTSASGSDVPSATVVVQLGKTLSDDIQFAAVFGLSIVSPNQMQYAYLSRRQAESVAIFLGSSILPLLYGLLGASVFLMRQMFGESQPGTVVAVTMAKAILRLGLGGIAGLAIGWFWVPDASKSVSEISKLSTAPFALAFLAGFSIELLFSLLDRIIAALNPAGVPPPNSGAR